MDWVQAGDSMVPALAAPGTSPAADCRSNPAAGEPSSAARQIDGGWSGLDLSLRPAIQDIARASAHPYPPKNSSLSIDGSREESESGPSAGTRGSRLARIPENYWSTKC